MSVESDESIPREGLIADTRHAGREEELFRINPSTNPTGRLADVADHCRQLHLHLCLLVYWLNECFSKANWEELRQHGQGLPSFCVTIVPFYQVNSRPCFSLLFFFFLTLVFLLLATHGGHE